MSERDQASALTGTAADAVRSAARNGAPDRYLAALLAPRAVRDDLIVLAAFSAEIDRISHHVREPYLGEIRVQWWRDALEAGQRGENSGHPVADAFSDAIRRHGLSLQRLADYFDAHVHRLYADPPADDTHLTLELDLIEGTLFAFAAEVLGSKKIAQESDILHSAAQAYGLARLARELPYALARGRVPFPPSIAANGDETDWWQAIDILAARARTHLAHTCTAYVAEPRAIRTALLPVALVEPYLRALSRPRHDPAHDIAEIAPLTRTWRLAKTHVLGRL